MGSEPDGSTSQNHIIDFEMGLSMQDEWMEDSYITQQGEWEDFVQNNDRFIEELDSREIDGDRYQITWSEDENINYYEEFLGDEEPANEKPSIEDSEEGIRSFEVKGENQILLKEQENVFLEETSTENNGREEILISLEQGIEKPWIEQPSKNRKWLETVFYYKHVLTPIPEEKTDLDRLVECLESLESEGQELNKENLGYRMLKTMGWVEGTGLGSKSQGKPFPLHLTGQRDRLGLGASREEGPKSQIDPNKVEWVLGSETLCYIKGKDVDERTEGRILSYFIELKIGGCVVKALLDTGASISVLTTGVLEKCPELIVRETQNEIKGIGNVKLKVGGVVCSDILIKGKTYKGETFAVLNSEELPVEAVLGLSFFRKNNIMLDLGKGMLWGDDGLGVRLIPKYHKKSLRKVPVYLAEDTLVPKRCQLLLLGEIKEKGLEDRDVMFDNGINLHWNQDGMCLGKSINKIKQGKILVPLINISEDVINLNKGTLLGEIDSLSPNVIESEETVEEGFLWAELGTGDSSKQTKEIFNINNKNRNVAELYSLDHIIEGREEIEGLLNKYATVTSVSEYDIGECRLPALDIDTGDHPPICIPPRRMSPHQKEKIRGHVQDMHRAGIIKLSNSAWSFPLVPVKKRDGDIRPCADLRQINAISRFEAHPLPHIGECLASLQGSKVFSSLDLNKGFNQMNLTENASDKCAFPFDGNLYQYLKVPFGLKQSPGWFQLQMQLVLNGLTPEEVLIYLDDFLIHSPTVESHLEILEQVLKRLEKFNLKIKPKKCELLKKQVNYLGHTITGEGIQPLVESLQAIQNFKTPKTCKEIKRFIGMAGWYRPFVPKFSLISRPLTQAMSKAKLEWTPECEEAFKEIKNCFLSTEVLAYPDYHSSHPLILTSDASASGAGAYLSQHQNGTEKIIGYFSKAFNEGQSKMSAFDKELEAIRLAVKHFRPHIAGKPIIIRTDHRPIVDLAKQKHLSSRLFRIYELLDSFEIIIEYVPGKCNVISDALSRVHEGSEIEMSKDPVVLPEHLEEYLIKGGGDSLVQALAHGIFGDEGRHEEVRRNIFNKVRGKPRDFGLTTQDINSTAFKKLQLEGEPLQLECLAWASQIYKINIIVLQNGTLPIKFKGSEDKTIHIINKDKVHFNSTQAREIGDSVMLLDKTENLIELEETGVKEELRICPNISIEGLLSWQQNSDIISRIKDAIKNGQEGKDIRNENELLQLWIRDYEKFKILKGLVVRERIGISLRDILWVPLVPPEMQKGLIQEVHEGLKHAGRDKVMEYMRAYFHFPKMKDEITEVISKCIACRVYKDHVDKNKAPYGQIRTKDPYELVCMDLAELPKSKSGHKYIMILVDHYSKKAMAVAIKNKEANTIANNLEKVFLPSFNMMPQQILSDNGREFKNTEVSKKMKKYKIKHLFSAPYCPANNGLVERCIGTFKSLIRTSGSEVEDWEQMLASVIIVYNNTFHKAIGMSPTEVFQGRTMKMALPGKNLEGMKGYTPYNIGDRVLRKVEGATKMGKRYEPGYVITRVNERGKTYIVKKFGGEHLEVKCHHNQLRLQEKGNEEEGPDVYDENEVSQIKMLANLSIRPGWEWGVTDSEGVELDQSSRYISLNSDQNSFEGFETSLVNNLNREDSRELEVVREGGTEAVEPEMEKEPVPDTDTLTKETRTPDESERNREESNELRREKSARLKKPPDYYSS